MQTLTFIPSGGLANRMRSIASAVNLSQHTGLQVNIVWFNDWGLRARFQDIFEPIPQPEISLCECNLIDKFTVDRARRKNFYIPSIYQHLVFDRIITEKQVASLRNQGFDFETWALKGRRPYMSCYDVFGWFSDYDLLVRQLFTPVRVIRDQIKAVTDRFTTHTIGMHIRRTDNIDSIRNSPIEKFLDTADRELAETPSTTIYLATDDEPTKHIFRQRYGQHVITPEAQASRQSLEGIRDGIVDMWALASTDIIYGSCGSSFSKMASSIGGIDVVL